MTRLHHRRTGSSGRSSTASGRRGIAYRTSGTGIGPPGQQGAGRRWSPGDTPERSGSLVEEEGGARSRQGRRKRKGSERREWEQRREDGRRPRYGRLFESPRNQQREECRSDEEKSVKGADDLKRRGSVDERTMTPYQLDGCISPTQTNNLRSEFPGRGFPRSFGHCRTPTSRSQA